MSWSRALPEAATHRPRDARTRTKNAHNRPTRSRVDTLMAEPLAFHLPLDAGLHSFNSFDSFGFFSGDFAAEGCGASALKMSFTQGTNGDVARATPAPEYQPRMSLARQSPAASDVLEARAETPGAARWSSEQQLNDASLVGYGRPSCGVASTSHDATEVRLDFTDDYLILGSPLARAASLDRGVSRRPRRRLPRVFSFSHADDSHAPAQVLPLNFGDMDVEQQADALFGKVRTLPIVPARRIAAAAPDRVARAPPRARVFGKDVEHVTSRRSPPDNAAFLPSPPISSLQGPLRTLSARTFETLLDETNVRENEVRTPRATDPPPSPPRDLAPPPPDARFHKPRGHPEGAWPAARARALSESPTRGTFFPPERKD